MAKASVPVGVLTKATEQVDTQNCETFADCVVGILELPLHDGRVDLDHNDCTQTCENHFATYKNVVSIQRAFERISKLTTPLIKDK